MDNADSFEELFEGGQKYEAEYQKVSTKFALL